MEDSCFQKAVARPTQHQLAIFVVATFLILNPHSVCQVHIRPQRVQDFQIIMEEHCGFTESRTAQPPLTRCNVQHRPITTLLPFSYCQETNEERSLSSWKDRLVQLSNLASIICAIDCTVLPVMTVLLSFLGLAEQPHQWEWLHMAGHGVAMYFVLPGMCQSRV